MNLRNFILNFRNLHPHLKNFNLNLIYFYLKLANFNMNFRYFKLNLTHFNLNLTNLNLSLTYYNLNLKRCRTKSCYKQVSFSISKSKHRRKSKLYPDASWRNATRRMKNALAWGRPKDPLDPKINQNLKFREQQDKIKVLISAPIGCRE